MNNPRARMTLTIAALFFVAIGIWSLATEKRATPAPAVVPSGEIQGHAAIAAPSAAVVQQLQESKGFEALVSYTDSGFEPATTSISEGQSIRFTNNSSHPVWIGQITAENTPSDPNTEYCDVPFNSCHAIAPGSFVEFTFPAEGAYEYMDDLDTALRGAVVVH